MRFEVITGTIVRRVIDSHRCAIVDVRPVGVPGTPSRSFGESAQPSPPLPDKPGRAHHRSALASAEHGLAGIKWISGDAC
jgi:hypothetical protein